MEVVNYPYKAGVYTITNVITGRMYVGSAVDLGRRQFVHFNSLLRQKHKNRHLQSSWNKYGEQAFVFAVLIYCDRMNTLVFEQAVLRHNQRVGRPLYNINPDATSRLGSKMSESAKERLRQRMMGNQYTAGSKLKPEHLARMSAALKGKNRICKRRGYRHSEETKLKLSRASTGKTHTPETRAKLSAAHTGRRLPEETKAKMSAALKGHTVSAETRKKIADANRSRALKRRVERENWKGTNNGNQEFQDRV